MNRSSGARKQVLTRHPELLDANADKLVQTPSELAAHLSEMQTN